MLNIDLENKIQLEPTDLIGRMVAVLGLTGTGKTNTAAVLIEELFASSLPMTIVDIEGEYYGLKTQFEILVAGRSENVDLEVSPDQAGQLAGISIERGISLVLDVSEFDEADRLTFLLNYFKGLWEANFKKKRPYAVFVEEAHEFIPQGMAPNTELKTLITRLALRGRKRGFSVVIMSQRSAKVAKDVLTQASLVFLHQVIHPSDMAVYKELIPLSAREVEEKVGGLAPGQCLVLYKNRITQVSIRLRHTLHVGVTPELGLPAATELKKLDKSILAEFKRAVAPPAVPESKPATGPVDARTQKELRELKAQLAAKNVEIERLKKRVAELEARPKIDIPFTPAKPQEPPRLPTKATVTPPTALSSGVDRRRDLAVQTLIKRLNKLPKSTLNLLLFLYQHEGKYFDLPTVANWLSYGEDSFRPVPLVSLDLLSRNKEGSVFKYTSNFSKYVRENFQGIDPNSIIETISQGLR